MHLSIFGQFDQIYGKYYDLAIFENELLVVEPAGPSIRVGIKNNGFIYSFLELRHPFSRDKDFPQQRIVPVLFRMNRTFCVENPHEDETRIIFRQRHKRFWQKIKNNTLTITCTNPEIPKRIEVTWK